MECQPAARLVLAFCASLLLLPAIALAATQHHDDPGVKRLATKASLDGGKVVSLKSRKGHFVKLDKPGDSARFTLSLPPGDYTLRLRSLAVKPDTFSELAISANGHSIRSQAVTNKVFTWQRSHFHHEGSGDVHLVVKLHEGAGVYLDRIWVHPLRMNFSINRLDTFHRDTTLFQDGSARCAIVIDDKGRYQSLGRQLADRIADRTGAQVKVIRGDQVSRRQFRKQNLIMLGDRRSTFALLQIGSSWSGVPDPPSDDKPQIYVRVNYFGTGTNDIVLGGKNSQQIRRSMQAFTDRLHWQNKVLTYPYGQLPKPENISSRKKYKRLAIQSSKWIRNGAIRKLMHVWKYYGDNIFQLLAYRYIEYKDSSDTISQVHRDGFIEAETMKLIGNYEGRAHHDYFDRLTRLQLTNTLLDMAEQCARIFTVELGPVRHPQKPEAMDAYLSHWDPTTLLHNHETFPARSIATAAQYFGRHYKLAKAKRWTRWAKIVMQGPLHTSKPKEDCWGYQNITMIHTARSAAQWGKWGYFDKKPVHQYLRLSLMSYDNLGSIVGYGDQNGYITPVSGNLAKINARRWLNMTGGRFNLKPDRESELVGLYIHPLEPMWYKYYKDNDIPLSKTFDKISFRNNWEPDGAYLLLDGISGGYHGHWDGNSILRFTDRGRMWLCEGDYGKTSMKAHDTVTVIRNGEGGNPGRINALEGSYASDRWGVTQTRTPHFNGLRWDRNILWNRQSNVFMVADELTADKAGKYDISSRFRTLGKTRIKKRSWIVRQKGPSRFVLYSAAGPARDALGETSVPEDAHNWKKYPYAKPTPRVLRHHRIVKLKPGDSTTMLSVFYVQPDQSSQPKVKTLSSNAVAMEAPSHAVIGAGALKQPSWKVDAQQFWIGSKRLLLFRGTSLDLPSLSVKSNRPITLDLDVSSGKGVLKSPDTVKLTIAGDAAKGIAIDGKQVGRRASSTTLTLKPGKHHVTFDADSLHETLQMVCRQSYETATRSAGKPQSKQSETNQNVKPRWTKQLPGDVTKVCIANVTSNKRPNLVVGDKKGNVTVLRPDGERVWQRTFDAPINDISIGDVNGDKQADIAVAVNDSHVYLIDAHGDPIWGHKFEPYYSYGGGKGNPNVVLVRDFDKDGKAEVAVGCENTYFYVLDNDGAVKKTHGKIWRESFKHGVSTLGAGDVTGDGQLELFAGWYHNARFIYDFSDTGPYRGTSIKGPKGGCTSITSANVDDDPAAEAIFANIDGSLKAAEKGGKMTHNRRAHILWERVIGDSAIHRVISGDFDKDGKDELAVASDSDFLACLNRQGHVRWLRYANAPVTDVTALAHHEGPTVLIRASADGTVAVYTPRGRQAARWVVGSPVKAVVSATIQGQDWVWAASGNQVHAAIIDF